MTAHSPAALLVHGGPISTLDGLHPRPEAMLISGDTVLALGDKKQLEAFWSPARHLDLQGSAVVPGLTDSHLHLLSYGLMLDQVQLGGVSSVAQLAALVGRAACGLAPDQWIIGRGWEQDALAERRYPNRHDLDAVTGTHPALLVRACGHCSVVNSRALALAGIGGSTPDPDGGTIERDEVTGEPTGVLHERAAGLVRQIVPQPDRPALLRALRQALRLAAARGLVACHPDDVRSAGSFAMTWGLYQELLAELGGPRVRFDVSDFAMSELAAGGLRSGSGNRLLSVGAVKTFVDGSLGARSAALSAPYADGAGCGITVQDKSRLLELSAEADRMGLQLAIHAIGDRAVDWALDAIDYAQLRHAGPKLRHRVVHAQITRPDQLSRFVALGAVAEIQPKFVTTDKQWVESRVGAARAGTSYAWASMLAAGVHCAGGSDGPVEPLDPLLGIYAAVTRQGMDGQPEGGWLPKERLTVEQSLRLFAEGGAYAAGAEQWRGTLTPGHAADFLVLDRSPADVDPAELKDLKVLQTYVGGRPI